jgi:hypothetical protein
MSPEHEKHLKQLLQELVRLAEARQVPITPETQIIYAEELIEFELCDLKSACRTIRRRPKGKFETAFPDLGTIIAETESATRARLRDRSSAFAGEYVPCPHHVSGYLCYANELGECCSPSDSVSRTLRTCPGRKRWEAAKAQFESQS